MQRCDFPNYCAVYFCCADGVNRTEISLSPSLKVEITEIRSGNRLYLIKEVAVGTRSDTGWEWGSGGGTQQIKILFVRCRVNCLGRQQSGKSIETEQRNLTK